MSVVLVVLVVSGFAVTIAAADSTTLELQAAETGESDSGTVSFTFTLAENATSVDLLDTSASRNGGDVSFSFDRWEDLDSSDSGTSSSWSATGGHTYRVVYDVTVDDGADEGEYRFDPEAEDDLGNQYSGTLTADVEVRTPAFENIGTQTTEVGFSSGSTGTETTSESVEVANSGDGYMEFDQATVSGVPADMDVSVESTPNRIDAGDSGTIDLDISVDDTISEGTHDFSVSLSDSLDNSESFTVEVDVTKYADLQVSQDSIDVGDVLIGDSKTQTITLREGAGYESISGISVERIADEDDASVSFPGASGVSIPAGGSERQSIEVSVDPNARQHERLEWDLRLEPQVDDGLAADLSVIARVIYPPYYDGVSVGNASLAFDEPKSEKNQFTTTVPLQVRNGGDLDMSITQTEVVVDDPDVSAEISELSTTIPPQSTETARVNIQADTSAAEGESTLTVRLTADEPGQVTRTSTVRIDHMAKLGVEKKDIDFGEIVVTKALSRGTTLSEELGYEDVRPLRIERVSGPDRGWLRLTERPTSLPAGESQALVASLTFDTRAELFNEYRWRYRVNGDNIQTTNITISGTPRPVNFNATIDDLEAEASGAGERGERIASRTADTLELLAEKLRTEDSPELRSDISTVSAAGRSTTLFLKYTSRARGYIENGNHSAAQEYLSRAAATYNTLSEAPERISNDEIRNRVNATVQDSNELLSTLLNEQRTHYRQRLESEDTTMLERAQTFRQLARISALGGEEQRARTLRNRSQQAFDRYATLISEGNANLRQAEERRENLTSQAFLSVAGRQLYLATSLDDLGVQSETIREQYTRAAEQFGEAGATSRAETARTEREEFIDRYQSSRTASLVLNGVLGIGFVLLVIYETRSLYRYIQESNASLSGDFLVTPDETP